MPFGNGVSYNKPADAGEIKGLLKDLAVGCYFLPNGCIEPTSFKTELENGEIGTFKILQINKRDEKRYNGKAANEFECTIQVPEGHKNVKLVFFPLECLWKLVM